MSNEQYLIVSYFFVAGLAMVMGLAVFASLRGPLQGLAGSFPNKNLACILKRLFPAGLVLPALAGFLSVSYRSCGESYESIVAQRSYLVGKNHEQLSAICLALTLAILAWGLLVGLSLVSRPGKPE